MYSVTPAVSYGGVGKKIGFYGDHKISNLGSGKDKGDIYGIYIGDSLCSRLDLKQK